MLFRILAETFTKIEKLSKRLDKTDELIGLFNGLEDRKIGSVISLTKGEISPNYTGRELGVAEKLAIKAIYMVTMIPERDIEKIRHRTGDIGATVEIILGRKKQTSLFSEPLTVDRVFRNLEKISISEGKASQDIKLKIIAEMLHDSTPIEGKYITRIICGKMRLGIADMTLIDAMAYYFTRGFEETSRELEILEFSSDMIKLIGKMKTKKTTPLNSLIDAVSHPNKYGLDDQLSLQALEKLDFLKKKVMKTRTKLERAYNIHPDLAFLAKLMVENGVEAIRNVSVEPGIPLRSMLAERLTSLKEILNKMGGKMALEYKYDGLRIQAHIKDINGRKGIKLFSRRMEDITEQFPDVVEFIDKGFIATDMIVEGECVPVNAETGELMPFQIISRRRGRKYKLDAKIREIPVNFILFDCLYLNGEDMTDKTYLKRRKAILTGFQNISVDIKTNNELCISKMKVVEEIAEGEVFFNESLESGCEGVMAKSLDEKSIYQAGNRGWMWIKYKKDYRTDLSDTFDLVVVGAFHGSGRRSGKYGALLMASYNQKSTKFETLCKLGSGFTDVFLNELNEILNTLIIEDNIPDNRVITEIEPDIYIRPGVVLEVVGSEISFSPVHTCGKGMLENKAGLALRFPRFTGRVRDDKDPEQATTTFEVNDIFNRQIKRDK